MKLRAYHILLAAIVCLATAVLIAGRGSGPPPLPHYVRPDQAKPATVARIHEAQRAAVDRCKLPPAVARERKLTNGAPGAQRAVDHDSGDCDPQTFENKSSVIPHGGLIGDWSNNDPISNWSAVRAHGIRGAYLKTSEGTSFHDSTLVGMARGARAAGLTAGGYHFAHVCLDSAVAEGQLFYSQLRAAGLLTPDALRPALDVEYGGCSSGAGGNAWIKSLYDYVQHATHQRVAVYSGNWWLGPHTACLFAHLPKETVAWISGYPNAVAPCGGRLDIHQFSDSYSNGANHSDMSRIVAARGEDILASGAPAAPPEATRQCRMHRFYVDRYHHFGDRLTRKGKLGAYGQARYDSAVKHLAYEHNYFVKNHEHGTKNYDCHSNGKVTVRSVKAEKPKPKHHHKASHHTSVSAPFRIVGGRAPAPSLIAPYIDIVTDGATVNSIYRGSDAIGVLHSCGLSTQAEVYARYGPGIANPPGFSTHELRSDGVAYKVPRGSKLSVWQVGIDVNDSDVGSVIGHARKQGWTMFQPYPGSRVEYHHINFLVRPAASGTLRDKIRARRERLPTHC